MRLSTHRVVQTFAKVKRASLPSKHPALHAPLGTRLTRPCVYAAPPRGAESPRPESPRPAETRGDTGACPFMQLTWNESH